MRQAAFDPRRFEDGRNDRELAAAVQAAPQSPTFLRCTRRVKDGKSHEYWNVAENRRLSDGRVVQRQMLYLGVINASQREAWRKAIELNDEGARCQVALCPAGSMPADDVDADNCIRPSTAGQHLAPSGGDAAIAFTYAVNVALNRRTPCGE